MKKHSGYSEFLIYTIVSVISAAISFFTMIYLTRVTTEDFFGKVNKCITASSVVMSIICMGLDSAYIRFYYEPPEKTNSKQLAWKCMLPSFIIIFIVGIILYFFRNRSTLILLIGSGGLIFSFAFFLITLSLYFIRYMTVFFRMSGRVLYFSIVNIALVLFTKTIFVVIYRITSDYSYNIIISSILLFIFTFFFFMFCKKDLLEIGKHSFRKYKSVYKFAFMSSPIFVITYLNSYLPQLVISNKLGDDILGIYTAALLFCSAIQVLSTGFTTFWSPYMYKNYSKSNKEIKNVHDVIMLGSVVVLSIILIFSDFIYMFIGEAFRKHQNMLGMLLIYPIILIVVETTSYGINIKKKNEISLIIYILSTVINILLCGVFVSILGLSGIALASMISALFQMIFMTYFGQKYYRSINSIIKTSFHMVVLVCSAISYYLLYEKRTVFIILEFLLVLICIIYDKKTIKWILDCIKQRN